MLSSAPISDGKPTPSSNRRRSLKFFLHLPTSLSSPEVVASNDVPAPSNTTAHLSSSHLATVPTHIPPDIILAIAAMLPSADILNFSMAVCTPRPCPPVTATLSHHTISFVVYCTPRPPRPSALQHSCTAFQLQMPTYPSHAFQAPRYMWARSETGRTAELSPFLA